LFITIKIRHRAASLALGVTLGLTALKLVVALLSHSAGVMSEAIHSFLDLVSAAVSYFTIREAGKPADEEHPFGHGKIETLSSLFESLLLILAAGLMIFEGVDHMRNPSSIRHEALAIGVICFSLVVSYWAFRQNAAAAKQTESSALQVNALHFFSDVVASLGVLLALGLMKITGWLMIDALIAFGVAAYVLLVSAKQVKVALKELTDTQLPQSEIQTIWGILDVSSENMPQKIHEKVQESPQVHASDKIIEAHDLRTRKSGATRHIDFHLVVCGQMSVEISHAVCDQLEGKIQNVFPQSSVNIHVEPCEKEKTQCHLTCPHLNRNKS